MSLGGKAVPEAWRNKKAGAVRTSGADKVMGCWAGPCLREKGCGSCTYPLVDGVLQIYRPQWRAHGLEWCDAVSKALSIQTYPLKYLWQ